MLMVHPEVTGVQLLIVAIKPEAEEEAAAQFCFLTALVALLL